MNTPLLDKPSILVHCEKSMDKTLFDIKWVPCSARFVVLGNYPRQTGAIQVCEMTSSGGINVLSEEEKKESFKCGTFGASSLKQRNFATGDFVGNLRIWDLEKTAGSPLFSVKAHSEIINSIDGVGGLGIGEGPKEIVTGSRDGSVKVWDPRQEDPVACMKPKEGETRRDCWSVAFGHAHNQVDRCVAAGYDNGDIKLFDLKNMSLRWDTNVKNGVCCVEFDRKDINMNKLVATVLESKVHVFDMRTQHPKKGFAKVSEKAHGSTVWAARHLPQNRDILMTLGGNGSAYLWKYHYPSSRVKKDKDDIEMGVAGTMDLLENTTISKQPINSFDWSPDKEGLAACTAFDQCVRVLIVTKLART